MKVIAYIAVLLLAAALVASILLIPHFKGYKDCIAEQQTSATNTPARESPIITFSCEVSFIDRHNGIVAAGATIVIAFFTIALWIATILLWKTGERQLRQTEKTNEHQLRAYIFIDACSLVAQINGSVTNEIIRAGCQPVVILQFKNTGQTPAHDVAIDSEMRIVPWPLAPNDLPPVTFAGTTTRESLGPGALRTKWNVQDVLSAGQIDSLRDETNALVIYGEIRYRDIFGYQRSTRFRYFAGGPVGLRGVHLASHSEGNQAT